MIPCIGSVAIRKATLFDAKKSINDDTIFVLAHVAYTLGVILVEKLASRPDTDGGHLLTIKTVMPHSL